MEGRESIRELEQYEYVELTLGENESGVRLDWNEIIKKLHHNSLIKIEDKIYRITRTGFSAIKGENKFATLHAVEINVETDLSQDTPIELDPYIQQ